jgi:integrase
MDLYRITEQKLKYLGYSENTINTYLHYVSEFEDKVGKHYTRLTAKDIQSYLYGYSFTSRSQQNQVISALKFAWQKGLGRKYLKIDFKRPRKEKKLPRIINAEEAAKKILLMKNKKHKAILALGLSCGLRVSEVVNLKVCDIDSSNKIIHINNAKGRKDRIVPLSDTLLSILREYYREYRPKEFMFRGQKSEKYSVSSCNKIVKNHLGVDKHYHLLRHTAFTSMLEKGTDIRVIQVAAGHESANTTAIYTHVSKKFINQIQTAI